MNATIAACFPSHPARRDEGKDFPHLVSVIVGAEAFEALDVARDMWRAGAVLLYLRSHSHTWEWTE